VTIVSNVVVVLDERVRTWTAVLAVAGWPELEMTRTPHGLHLQSKALSHHLRELDGLDTLPIVQGTKEMLANEGPLAPTLTAALAADQADAAKAFADAAGLAEFWAAHTDVWAEAVAHLTEIVNNAPIVDFCTKLLANGRVLPAKITICPTLTYPLLSTVLSTDVDNFIIAVPPPKAWGASSPWPYAEWADEVMFRVMRALAGQLFATDLADASDEQKRLATYAAAILFLETAFGEATGMAFLVQKKREDSLPRLPLAVEAVRDHIADPNQASLASRLD